MYKKYFSFHPVIRIRLLLKFFTILTKTTVMPYTVIYFSMKIGVQLTTLLIVVIGIISIIGYLAGGKSADKYGRKKNIMYSEMDVLFGKLLSVLHRIATKQCVFDEAIMMRDIPYLKGETQ